MNPSLVARNLSGKMTMHLHEWAECNPFQQMETKITRLEAAIQFNCPGGRRKSLRVSQMLLLAHLG